mmetsp:Transcript_1384/g.4413  ORF Transcript_1384/g.4413 Transcript_1384/m.4413 type:complete len:267 (+) Transcript_1384:86-886(+)
MTQARWTHTDHRVIHTVLSADTCALRSAESRIYYPRNVDGADAEGCSFAQRRHLVRTAPATSATKLTSKGSEVSLETTCFRALTGLSAGGGEIAAGPEAQRVHALLLCREAAVHDVDRLGVNPVDHLSHGGPAHLKREPDGAAVDNLALLPGVVAVARQVKLEEGAEPERVPAHHHHRLLPGGRPLRKVLQPAQTGERERLVAGVDGAVHAQRRVEGRDAAGGGQRLCVKVARDLLQARVQQHRLVRRCETRAQREAERADCAAQL